ncbi:transporter substrate-binding domain-containing protein [Lacimicrobium sp. SS2-24]|uniref:substrate-binding periplasmic protein n=1 Tax=Lacimicrobium sp. SS2-24 TaxID=2005569 RepID=UPI00143CAEC0|nr:transporter substrate-binding domain-containing protein [Lacimicrobium sp. SS2-24]
MRHGVTLTLIVLFSLLLGSCAVDTRPVVILYTYHSDPPFYLPGENNDLSREWVRRFNQWQQRIKLELVHIERSALNRIVDNGAPYIILWANPLWFDFRDNALRASAPIFWDADIVVSHPNHPVEYHTPSDLTGLRLGTRDGFFYKGLNPLIDSEQLTRIDTEQDSDNYVRLHQGDIDAFIMTRASLLYWRTHQPQLNELSVAAMPHDAYSRHVLVSEGYRRWLPLFNAFISDCAASSQWQSQLHYWGVEELLNPFELELDELMELDADNDTDAPVSQH